MAVDYTKYSVADLMAMFPAPAPAPVDYSKYSSAELMAMFPAPTPAPTPAPIATSPPVTYTTVEYIDATGRRQYKQVPVNAPPPPAPTPAPPPIYNPSSSSGYAKTYSGAPPGQDVSYVAPANTAGTVPIAGSENTPIPTAVLDPASYAAYQAREKVFTGDLFDALLSLGSTAVTPYIGGITSGVSSYIAPVVGAAAAPAAAAALVQGALAEARGGNFIEGALTGGIGSLAAPIASSIGADVFKLTDSQALADAAAGAIKAGAGALPAGLISGDLGNVLSSALMGGAISGATSGLSDITGLAPKDISNAIKAVQNLDNPLALAGIAISYLPGPTMPGAGTTEDIQEGFFEPGGPGFMPTEYLDDEEVQRELTSLLGRYPTPAAPSEWFLGENVPSGVPEWDMAAVNAGLPIGNLEQDFYVAQTKQGPRIVDSAGNVGTFVNGEFVVDTGVTPDLSYAAAPAPASASAPAPAPAPAPIPSAKPTPAPAPTVTAAKKQDDLGLLMALAGMMTPQQQAKDDYQLAQIGVVSPYGIYGA